MKIKKIVSIVSFLVISAVFSGCASIVSLGPKTEFYGVKISGISVANSFVIKSYDGKNINFSTNKNIDSKIAAYGSLYDKLNVINISIYNDGNTPIGMNYFMDEYEIITLDDKLFILEKPDLNDYPSKSNINPGDSISLTFKKPYNVTIENIKMIICKLYYDTIIVLKPLPTLSIKNEERGK